MLDLRLLKRLLFLRDQSIQLLQPISTRRTAVTEPIKAASRVGNVVTFDALSPQADNLMDGLTIAVVTKSKDPFATAGDVANDMSFRTGFIS